MNTHESWELLLMKAVDGVLEPEERPLFDAHLAECQGCRDELADFNAIKGGTDQLRERILADARIEAPRPARAERRLIGLGTLLFVAGMVLLLGFSAYVFFADLNVPLPLKVALGLIGLGALVLFFFVARAKLRSLGVDPYNEIDQ